MPQRSEANTHLNAVSYSRYSQKNKANIVTILAKQLDSGSGIIISSGINLL